MHFLLSYDNFELPCLIFSFNCASKTLVASLLIVLMICSAKMKQITTNSARRIFSSHL